MKKHTRLVGVYSPVLKTVPPICRNGYHGRSQKGCFGTRNKSIPR